MPSWIVTPPSTSHDFPNTKLPYDEAIMEAMDSIDRTWNDMHHRVTFIPNLEYLDNEK
jgi:hypothetical protein